ncbi:MAG: regulatory protein RecX [Clostridia bacterium]|nr:regulatory protein RecX [Clostridia bacterium]
MELTVKSSKNGKIKIYADGECIFTVPAVIWYSSHLREGDEVTNEELSALKKLGDSSSAFESGMRMLSLRAHSEFELKQKLSMKFSKEAAESAIERLKELSLIDDEKFALMLAEELYERKGYAPKRILLELKNRGISGNYAENAVNALDINKEIGIIKVIEKCGITENSTNKEKDRVIRRLLNMGYSYSDISKYINIYE